MNNVQTAITAIRNIETSEELNQLIEAFKLQRTYLARQSARSLTVGAMVTFEGRGGKMVTGVVDKINRKTVVVTTPTGKWRVTASMIKQVA